MKGQQDIRLEPYIEELLEKRYYLPGEKWVALCERVSGALFGEKGMEKLRKEAFEAFLNRRAIMASPTLMNAGGRLGMLSSCFIYPVHDSLKSIMATLTLTADTFKKAGGVGIDFSTLRPAGATIEKTGGVSTGPVSFMGFYDWAGKAVSGGGLRKAAQIAVLRAEHPDVWSFVSAKSDAQRSGDGTHLSSINLSVAAPDALFRLADLEGSGPEDWFSCVDDKGVIAPNGWRRPTGGTEERAELPEHTSEKMRDQYGEQAVRQAKEGLWHLHWGGVIYDTVSAQKVLRSIAEEAWEAGCPGVIFIDQVNRRNFVPNVGYIRNPNPCGEFYAPLPGVDEYNDEPSGLPPFDNGGPTCNLGSINLDAHVRFIEGGEKWAWEMDLETLEKTTRLMTRTLDRVVDVNRLPTLESTLITQLIRPIGLGVFGLANVLIRLGLRYNGEEGRAMASELLERVTFWSMDESVSLAVEARKQKNTVGRFDPDKLRVAWGTWRDKHKKESEKPHSEMTVWEAAGHNAHDDSSAFMWTPEDVFSPWKGDDPLRGSFPSIRGSRWDFSDLELGDLKTETISRQSVVERFKKGGFAFAAGLIECGRISIDSWLDLFRRIKKEGIRHCHTTFLMPTGTTSFICNCTESSGIEPLYQLTPFKRKHAETTSTGGTVYVTRKYYPQVVLDYAERVLGLDRNKVLNGEVEIPLKNLPPYFVAAFTMTPDDHVLMQAVCQRVVHNGISKTVNLPESATVEDVLRVFRKAREMGCFGVTVYRHHSKTEQIYDQMEVDEGRRILPKAIPKLPLSDKEASVVFRITDPAIRGGKIFATVTLLDGKWPIEVFLNFDAGIPEEFLEVVKSRNLTARLTSNLLRRGTSAEEIIRNLEKCSRGKDFHYELAQCFKGLLADAHQDDPNEVLPERTLNVIRPRCTTSGCKGRLILEGGCYKCPECGYSVCG